MSICVYMVERYVQNLMQRIWTILRRIEENHASIPVVAFCSPPPLSLAIIDRHLPATQGAKRVRGR
jgi:hypothetical protein